MKTNVWTATPWHRRFWKKIDKKSEYGCWIWTAFKDRGYGKFHVPGLGVTYAHRVAYTMFVDDIPNDKVLDHLCLNRSCVNPLHLEAVECKVNVLRGRATYTKYCKRGHVFERIMPKSGKPARQCRHCQNEWVRNKRKKMHICT